MAGRAPGGIPGGAHRAAEFKGRRALPAPELVAWHEPQRTLPHLPVDRLGSRRLLFKLVVVAGTISEPSTREIELLRSARPAPMTPTPSNVMMC